MTRIALVLFLAACSKKAEKMPTCAEVTDHVLGVVTSAMPGHGDMGGQGQRKAQIEQCEARDIPAKERNCILAAQTMEAIGQCRRAGVKNPNSEEGSAK